MIRSSVTSSPSSPDSLTWFAANDPIPVVAWEDPLVDSVGFDPLDIYVETYWLPILGPSTTWALRRISTWLMSAGTKSGIWVPQEPLARSLGLGGKTSRHSPALRALGRLIDFHMAVIVDETLAVRTVIPPLTSRNVERLPAHLVAQHRADHPHTTAPSSAGTDGLRLLRPCEV